jgi:hypothetical protein
MSGPTSASGEARPVPLHSDQIEAAAGMLARAFHQGPLACFVLPDQRRRRHGERLHGVERVASVATPTFKAHVVRCRGCGRFIDVWQPARILPLGRRQQRWVDVRH